MSLQIMDVAIPAVEGCLAYERKVTSFTSEPGLCLGFVEVSPRANF